MLLHYVIVSSIALVRSPSSVERTVSWSIISCYINILLEGAGGQKAARSGQAAAKERPRCGQDVAKCCHFVARKWPTSCQKRPGSGHGSAAALLSVVQPRPGARPLPGPEPVLGRALRATRGAVLPQMGEDEECREPPLICPLWGKWIGALSRRDVGGGSTCSADASCGSLRQRPE